MADIVVKKPKKPISDEYGNREFGQDAKDIISMYARYLMQPNRDAGATDQTTPDIFNKLNTPSSHGLKYEDYWHSDFGGPSPRGNVPQMRYPVREFTKR